MFFTERETETILRTLRNAAPTIGAVSRIHYAFVKDLSQMQDLGLWTDFMAVTTFSAVILVESNLQQAKPANDAVKGT